MFVQTTVYACSYFCVNIISATIQDGGYYPPNILKVTFQDGDRILLKVTFRILLTCRMVPPLFTPLTTYTLLNFRNVPHKLLHSSHS